MESGPIGMPVREAAQLDDAIVVALGSNACGVWRDCREALEAALARFRAEGIDVLARSSWWRSAAWPDPTDLADATTAFLRTLIDEGARIVAVRRGGALEERYFGEPS